MADYIIQDTTLTAIADAIREKIGETAALTPAEMATMIAGIETGGGLPDGVSALAKGAFVPAIDFTDGSYGVAHGLDVVPNFWIVFPANEYVGTSWPSVLLEQYFVKKKFTPSNGNARAGTKVIVYSSPSGTGAMTSSNVYTISNACDKTYFYIKLSPSYKLPKGQNYHWIAGVIDILK